MRFESETESESESGKISETQADLRDVTVEYISLPGWKTSTEHCRDFSQLPENARNYVLRVEELLKVPSKISIYRCLFL